MVRHRFISDRKLFANSFLLRWYAIVSCRTGNYSPTVSCGDGTQSFHVGWETIRQQFPVAMIRHRFTSSRKPYANSFLSSCFAIASCRIGNPSPTVSCCDGTQSFHFGRGTFAPCRTGPIIFQGTGKCRFPGDHRCLFSCYHNFRDTNISERTENYETGNDRTGMHY